MGASSLLIVLFLGVISICLLTMTLLFLIASRNLHQLTLKIHTLLPACEEAFKEARRTLVETRELVSRTSKTTHHVEEVIHRTCDGASELLDQFALLKERAATFFKERFGNGSRPKPRR